MLNLIRGTHAGARSPFSAPTGLPGLRRSPAAAPDINPDTLDKIPAYAQKYFTRGNKVTPLFDPQTSKSSSEEIFAQAKKLIKSAKTSVQIEMFNIDKKEMIDLLKAEAKRGIKVQVIMDPPDEDWEAPRKAAIEDLRKNGVDVQIYPAKPKGDPDAKYGQLDHVKMLLVDGKSAIIGGMNWGEHSPANHDYDVRVEGPAVEKMEWLFREDWVKSGGDGHALPYIEKVPEAGDTMVNLVVSSLEPNEQTIGKTIHRAIENARKSIHTELFVLSDPRTVYALKDAHERGVDVKVVLHPLKIEGKAINEWAFNELKKAGVPVKWYVCDPETKQKLHAKIGLFDDDQVIVGSANWSKAGFGTNREADVEILSKKANKSFESVFDRDWKTRTADEPTYIEDPIEDPGG
jgi:cardiolipin synthase